MGNQTDSTTADFDAGTKSQSTGNRDMITVTDAVNGAVGIPAANELQLENLYSDKYDVADADGNTAKWSVWYRQGTANGSADIDTSSNDKARLQVLTGVAVSTEYGLTLDSLIDETQDFTVQVTIQAITQIANVISRIRFWLLNGHQGAIACEIERERDAVNTTIKAVVSGGGYASVLDTTNPVSFRVRFTAATNTYALDYDVGAGWVQLQTGVFAGGNVEVYLSVVTSTNFPTITADFSNLTITAGSLIVPYRTSGNFVSRTVDCGAAGQKVTGVVLNVNCPNVNTTLKNGVNDALEIYENTVDDFATSTKLDGWTNAELLTAGMTEAGVNSTITLSGLALGTKRYKWYKVYGIGDGATTFKIFDVTTTYASTGGSGGGKVSTPWWVGG